MANIYTCTASTGDITGLTTETSGNVKINYTLSNSSAGSAGGNSADGTYEDVVTFDGVVALVGYTGVLTVNSVNGLTTKTQTTQVRVQTHDANVLGSELVVNGDFDADTDWVKQNGSTIAGGIATVIGAGSLTSSGANWSLSQRDFISQNVLYKISFDVKQTVGTDNFLCGIGWSNDFSKQVTSTMTRYAFMITSPADTGWDDLNFGGLTIGDEFELDNISIKEVTQEDKLYINGTLQPETPTLPTGTLVANEVASIGYPDIVTRHHGDLVVRTDVVVP